MPAGYGSHSFAYVTGSVPLIHILVGYTLWYSSPSIDLLTP